MKRFILIMTVVLSCVLLCACKEKELSDNTELQENPVNTSYITTEKVQYAGWKDFISDGQYVVSSSWLLEDQTAKCNIKTGNITGVCLTPDCLHRSLNIMNYDETFCRVPQNEKLYFIRDGKLYCKYVLSSFDEELFEATGNAPMNHVEYFGYYDMTTGEGRDLLEMPPSDYSGIYNFFDSENYIYYLRYIPTSDDPQSITDYNLHICRMSFESYEEEILCYLDGKIGIDGASNPAIVAVENDETVYLAYNATGELFSIKTDGSDFRFLIDGEDGFIGIYDGYGTFYLDGYIYFTAYVSDIDSSVTDKRALYLYRINCETGEKERLTEDYIRWLFVSDSNIYYEMYTYQPTEEQLAEARPEEFSHTFKQMNHDGSNVKTIGSFVFPYVTISGVWGAGEHLYFYAGYSEMYYKEDAVVDAFTIKLNVVDGTYEEINKAEGLE